MLSIQKQEDPVEAIQRSMDAVTLAQLRRENRQLRERLDELLHQARVNEKKLRRLQHQEMELLGLDSLSEVILTLTVDYPRAFGLSRVMLVLVDVDDQIRKLFEQMRGAVQQQLRDVVLLPDSEPLDSLFGKSATPRLGGYDTHIHASLLGDLRPRPGSVAMLPLFRRGRLTGCLVMAARDPERFARDKDTYFLERLATTVAVSVESAINHERLAILGLIDPLTEINNRRFFDQRLDEEVMRTLRGKAPLACLLIDVDHFKRINDTHGHQAGDSVLQRVAALLRQHLRGQDVLARYGGEEFVALLSGTTVQRARVIAERIRLALEQKLLPLENGETLQITASIGVSLLEPMQHQGEFRQLGTELIERADQALYKAKENGRNRVIVAD